MIEGGFELQATFFIKSSNSVIGDRVKKWKTKQQCKVPFLHNLWGHNYMYLYILASLLFQPYLTRSFLGEGLPSTLLSFSNDRLGGPIYGSFGLICPAEKSAPPVEPTRSIYFNFEWKWTFKEALAISSIHLACSLCECKLFVTSLMLQLHKIYLYRWKSWDLSSLVH